jgi:hypothetical protein
LNVENFLNGYHVRIKFGNHGSNALWIRAPVKPAAFMDIVGSQPNAGSHC